MTALSDYFSDPVNVHTAIMWAIFAFPLICLVFIFLKMFRNDKNRIEAKLDQFARQIELCSNEGDLLVIRDNIRRYAGRHCAQDIYRHRVSNLLISADVKQYRLNNQIQS